MPGSPSPLLDERGASSAEYALLVAFIAVVIFGAVTSFGASVESLFDSSCASVATAAGGTC